MVQTQVKESSRLGDVKGETVVVGIVSPATKFDKVAPQARKVVDSETCGDA